jgi:hypothetical protein
MDQLRWRLLLLSTFAAQRRVLDVPGGFIAII